MPSWVKMSLDWLYWSMLHLVEVDLTWLRVQSIGLQSIKFARSMVNLGSQHERIKMR